MKCGSIALDHPRIDPGRRMVVEIDAVSYCGTLGGITLHVKQTFQGEIANPDNFADFAAFSS